MLSIKISLNFYFYYIKKNINILKIMNAILNEGNLSKIYRYIL